MNSIESLAKERGGAIEALSLIGLSASWIGALATHPGLFKQYLREYKRTSSRVVHPDLGETALSQRAADIYSAFDLLNETDDDSLVKAMREYTDKFSIPRVEALNLISSLKREIENAKQELAVEKSVSEALKKAKDRPDDGGLNVLLNFLQSQFQQPEDDLGGGKIIKITDLVGKLFYTSTWIGEDEDNHTNIHASMYVMYVDHRGIFYKEEIYLELPREKSPKVREKLLVAAKKNIAKKSSTLARGEYGNHGGAVLGFVTSNVYDMEAVASIFPSYKPDENPELSIELNSQDFVEGAKQNLTSIGIFYAYTPKQLEQLSNGELGDPKPWLGIVVLENPNPENSTVKCGVYYIEGFISDKEKSL